MLGLWTGFWWVTVPCSQLAWCQSPLKWSGKPRDGGNRWLSTLLKIDISISDHVSPVSASNRSQSSLLVMLPVIFPCTNNVCFLFRPRSQCNCGEDHGSIITGIASDHSGGRQDRTGMGRLQALLHPQAARPHSAQHQRSSSPVILPQLWGHA